MKRTILFFLFLIPMTLHADNYVAGKDYQIIPTSALTPENTGPTVTEFFSYGCPWCYKLEKGLDAWEKTLPSNITFSRVPVVFESGWELYAKAYYTAKAINKENTISPALFDAIQEKKQSLKTVDAMITFFTQHGVDKKIANSAFVSSPSIDAQVKQGMQHMQVFGITSVPTLVINNKYRIDLPMADGDEKRFFDIANFLLKQNK